MAEAPGGEYDVDLGLVVGPRGTEGAMVVESLTAHPERLAEGQRVWLQPRFGRGCLVLIAAVLGERADGNLVMQFEGVADREMAARLSGAVLRGRSADSPPLPEGEYYEYQLVGLEVVTVEGRRLGQVDEVLRTAANDVLVVGDHMLPAVAEVVRSVDVAAGRVIVAPTPGMLDEDEA